jgi:hypothetical protein
MGEVARGSPQGRNGGESKRHTRRALMPRSQGQASVVRAAITQVYLPQKKLLGRWVEVMTEEVAASILGEILYNGTFGV